MTKVIQFKNNQEEQRSCPLCDLAFEYLELCKHAETEEELFEVLSDLIQEGIHLGVVNYLQQELTHKVELLDDLTYGSDECCDECNCEDEE